jgi:hypothetical protein
VGRQQFVVRLTLKRSLWFRACSMLDCFPISAPALCASARVRLLEQFQRSGSFLTDHEIFCAQKPEMCNVQRKKLRVGGVSCQIPMTNALVDRGSCTRIAAVKPNKRLREPSFRSAKAGARDVVRNDIARSIFPRANRNLRISIHHFMDIFERPLATRPGRGSVSPWSNLTSAASMHQ